MCPEHDSALTQLIQRPILRLPDFTRTFILQADDSDSRTGAALLPRFEDGIFPIVYASKKLLKREIKLLSLRASVLKYRVWN